MVSGETPKPAPAEVEKKATVEDSSGVGVRAKESSVVDPSGEWVQVGPRKKFSQRGGGKAPEKSGNDKKKRKASPLKIEGSKRAKNNVVETSSAVKRKASPASSEKKKRPRQEGAGLPSNTPTKVTKS